MKGEGELIKKKRFVSVPHLGVPKRELGNFTFLRVLIEEWGRWQAKMHT